MYNRCKRGHTLLATAFHGLHLAKFIEDMTDKDDFISDLKNIAIQGPVNVQDIPQNIKQVFDEYEKFVYETLAGKRGKKTLLMFYIELSNAKIQSCSDMHFSSYCQYFS